MNHHYLTSHFNELFACSDYIIVDIVDGSCATIEHSMCDIARCADFGRRNANLDYGNIVDRHFVCSGDAHSTRLCGHARNISVLVGEEKGIACTIN